MILISTFLVNLMNFNAISYRTNTIVFSFDDFNDIMLPVISALSKLILFNEIDFVLFFYCYLYN